MSMDSDNALEKNLSANLGRVIDWLKFAETKNAALLAFCSAWIIAIANFVFNAKGAPVVATVAAASALPLFVLGALLALVSFIPRTGLASFFSRGKNATRTRNLLFFGDLRKVPLEAAGAELSERYGPAAGRSITDNFVEDIAVQIVVNSRIAYRKFQLFDWAASCVIGAFAVMTLIPIVLLLFRMFT